VKSKLLVLCLAVITPVLTAYAADRESPRPVEYTLISSQEISHVNDILRDAISQLLPDAREIYLDYNSPRSHEYINNIDIPYIPYVVFDSSITASSAFFHMAKNNMVEQREGYYVIPDQQLRMGEIMLLGRTRQPDELSVFVMSLCPYTKEVLALLINFIRRNDIDIDIKLRYIVNYNETGVYSRQGPDEIDENLRQITMQNKHPEKFLDYLLLAQSMGHEEAFAELGLSPDITDNDKENALLQLKKDFAEKEELGIKRSPVFLWENIYLIPSLDMLAQHRPFNAKKPAPGTESAPGGPVPLHFFYSTRCTNCAVIKKDILPAVESEYKDKVVVHYHNVSNADAFALQINMHKERNSLELGIPIVPEIFLPAGVLSGENEIIKRLGITIEESLKQAVPAGGAESIPADEVILDIFSRFSPAVVAFAGLADGINPCAFTTLIFFVSFLTLYSYSKKKILVAGISFMLAVFTTYLLLGIGGAVLLDRIGQFSLLSAIVKYAVSSFAFILCILAIYDLILYKRTGRTEGLKLQLPGFIKSLMHKNITETYRGKDKAGINLAYLFALTFSCGVFIAALESVCTGQIYLPTITFIMTISDLRMHAFAYLLLYNACFMLPLTAVFILSYKGVTSESFMKFSQRHMGAIKIMYALLFLGLGLSIFMY
jgi:hypothetical protein